MGGGAHYSKVDSREELALQESDNGKMTNGESTEVLNLEEGGKKSDEEEVCSELKSKNCWCHPYSGLSKRKLT